MREHLDELAQAGLVDTTTEEQYTRYWDLLPPETRGLLEEIQRDNPEGLDHAATVASMADLRASRRSLGDLPLVVLTRGKEDPPPPGVSPELSAKMAQVWREMQAELPSFSTNSAQIIAENSQHHVHWDASRLVVASIQKVVEAARAHGRIDAAALAPLGKLPRENNP